jgi:hypothetical protein
MSNFSNIWEEVRKSSEEFFKNFSKHLENSIPEF